MTAPWPEHSLSVLVVDDSPEDVAAYKRHLCGSRDCECAVTHVDDVDEAIATILSQRPDLVLLDYNLPGATGLELLNELVSVHGGVPVPVIMLTGQGSEEVAVAALKAGATDYLPKGRITADCLRHTARQAIAKFALERTVREQQAQKDELIRELQAALAEVNQLAGLLPICAGCKKIRDDSGYWNQVEEYLGAHADVEFSHGMCPDCFDAAKTELDHAMQAAPRPDGEALPGIGA